MCQAPRRTAASPAALSPVPDPTKTPNISYDAYFPAQIGSARRLPWDPGVWRGWERGWPGSPPQLTQCCGSRRCGGRRYGRSRRVGSRRYRSPSSRGGSGRSGVQPRRVCRDSHRCWGRRRCGDPRGARPIPGGGRSKLRGTRRDGVGGESICECKNSEKLGGMKAREMPVKRLLCLGTVMFLGFFFFSLARINLTRISL